MVEAKQNFSPTTEVIQTKVMEETKIAPDEQMRH